METYETFFHLTIRIYSTGSPTVSVNFGPPCISGLGPMDPDILLHGEVVRFYLAGISGIGSHGGWILWGYILKQF